jgi:hypothetical protein
VKAALESWCKSQAIRELVKLKSDLPPEDYSQELQKLLNDFGDDKYIYGSDEAKRRLNTQAGRIAHLRILLGEPGQKLTETELTEMILEKGDEIFAFAEACTAKVEHIMKELGENPDPKALLRRLQAAGLWE